MSVPPQAISATGTTARASATAAVLLDALGTLVALEAPAPSLRSELSRRFGVDVSLAEAEHAIAAEIAYYRANLDTGRDPPSLAMLRARCAEALRGGLPPSRKLDDVPARKLTDALLASLRFSAYDDVRPALCAARARGTRLVVVSNWDASLREVLGRLGLSALLDGVLSSAEAGARKPARAIFERGLRLAGTRPEQTIHVGDSFEEDVAGARAAGIEAVLLRREGGPGPAGVHTVRSLKDLDALRF